jgi:malonate transporter and related proteins
MKSILVILLPIFGLILAGYVFRRRDILGPNSARELNRFVIWLALPALLFMAMARSSLATLYQPGFAAAFGLASLATFVAVLLWRRRSGRALADCSVDALSASYSNTGYVGIPLATLAFGPESLVAATIATIFVVCVLFAIAAVAIEVALQQGRRGLAMWAKVLGAIVRNPLVVAPVAGIVLSAAGGTVPPGVDTFLQLLGAAAIPCALVGLGLFLAEHPATSEGDSVQWVLVAIKLVALPLLTWVLAVHVFAVPPFYAQLAVLMAALPTGTGPFMLAEFYQRDARVSSRTVLWSTVLSLFTLTVLLLLLR